MKSIAPFSASELRDVSLITSAPSDVEISDSAPYAMAESFIIASVRFIRPLRLNLSPFIYARS